MNCYIRLILFWQCKIHIDTLDLLRQERKNNYPNKKKDQYEPIIIFHSINCKIRGLSLKKQKNIRTKYTQTPNISTKNAIFRHILSFSYNFITKTYEI